MDNLANGHVLQCSVTWSVHGYKAVG